MANNERLCVKGDGCYIEGPDDELRYTWSSRWAGRYYIAAFEGEQRVYEFQNTNEWRDGVPVYQWNRVTDPEVVFRMLHPGAASRPRWMWTHLGSARLTDEELKEAVEWVRGRTARVAAIRARLDELQPVLSEAEALQEELASLDLSGPGVTALKAARLNITFELGKRALDDA